MKKEDALEVCRLIIEDGITCREACRQMQIKDGSFFYMVNKDSEVFEYYARAREVQSHRWIDEIIDLADDSKDDFKQTEDGVRINHENIQRAKLRIDTRKWAAAKALPKIYGEKLQIDGNMKHEVKKLPDWMNETES